MTRSTFLPFALPDTGEAEINEVADTIRSGWITTGPKTHRFETEFAAAVGAKYTVAVNSCTAAMHLSLEAVGLQSGDLVLTSPYTFAATAEVVRYFNAVPIFIDIDPNTLNISPTLLAQAAHDLAQGGPAAQRWLPPSLQSASGAPQRVTAILPIHIAGLPADLDPIYALAAQHNLAVIEDAAHAFPAQYKGRWIGSTANNKQQTTKAGPGRKEAAQLPAAQHPSSAVCFSFYATKTISTGEGGMIATDNPAIAERCRMMALHGISKDAWKRYQAEGSWYYEIIAPGHKYNFTDIAAAMGLVQLSKAEKMWQRRREIAQRYNQAFAAAPELQIPFNNSHVRHAWHLYTLRLNLNRLSISRRQFIQELKTRHIGTSVHFIPIHLHPYYRETYGYQPQDFPATYQAYRREISLPIYSKMSDDDVQDVIEAVLNVVRQFHKR